MEILERTLENSHSLNYKEERELSQRIQKGDQLALHKLIISNVKFVISIANEYRGLGIAFEDLVSEGIVGLLEAAYRFDGERGLKFISYAVHWIRQSMLFAISKYSRMVRLPLYVSHILNRSRKAQTHLKNQLGREPTIKELADYLDISEEILSSTLYSEQWISLQSTVGRQKDTYLQDLIMDKQSNSEEYFIKQEIESLIDKIINTLTGREQTIINMYYGLNGYTEHTLKEIAPCIGLSKERVRQIKQEILVKLRKRLNNIT